MPRKGDGKMLIGGGNMLIKKCWLISILPFGQISKPEGKMLLFPDQFCYPTPIEYTEWTD